MIVINKKTNEKMYKSPILDGFEISVEISATAIHLVGISGKKRYYGSASTKNNKSHELYDAIYYFTKTELSRKGEYLSDGSIDALVTLVYVAIWEEKNISDKRREEVTAGTSTSALDAWCQALASHSSVSKRNEDAKNRPGQSLSQQRWGR